MPLRNALKSKWGVYLALPEDGVCWASEWIQEWIEIHMAALKGILEWHWEDAVKLKVSRESIHFVNKLFTWAFYMLEKMYSHLNHKIES